MLVNAADGKESARYEYGPFAEPLRMTGPMAKINPIRFSTQYADDVTGDIKYLYRDYTAGTGRWRSRDPIGEKGGINLFAFVCNNALLKYDRLGHEDNETVREKFDAWYADQKANMSWLKSLPDCPCSLQQKKCFIGLIYTGSYMYFYVAPNGWTLATTILLQKYHPGGVYDLRQNVKAGESGQQCIYDMHGKLITHGPGAGTPDRAGSEGGLWGPNGHLAQDVYPYEWALQLDGSPSSNPNIDGEFYKKYMEVRPPNEAKNEKGELCPRNP